MCVRGFVARSRTQQQRRKRCPIKIGRWVLRDNSVARDTTRPTVPRCRVYAFSPKRAASKLPRPDRRGITKREISRADKRKVGRDESRPRDASKHWAECVIHELSMRSMRAGPTERLVRRLPLARQQRARRLADGRVTSRAALRELWRRPRSKQNYQNTQ